MHICKYAHVEIERNLSRLPCEWNESGMVMENYL